MSAVAFEDESGSRVTGRQTTRAEVARFETLVESVRHRSLRSDPAARGPRHPPNSSGRRGPVAPGVPLPFWCGTLRCRPANELLDRVRSRADLKAAVEAVCARRSVIVVGAGFAS